MNANIINVKKLCKVFITTVQFTDKEAKQKTTQH